MTRPDIPLLDIQAWRAGTPTQEREWLLGQAASATVENTRVLG